MTIHGTWVSYSGAAGIVLAMVLAAAVAAAESFVDEPVRRRTRRSGC
jgi:hypothetical protein